MSVKSWFEKLAKLEAHKKIYINYIFKVNLVFFSYTLQFYTIC